jgi:hypothetical protein
MTVIFAVAVSAVAVSAPMKVKIDKIQGKVEMREGGSAWKAAVNGASVPLSAEIRTGAGASCMLKWAGGNVVKVSPMSQLKISEADKSANGKENSTVELANGKVSAHAKKFNTPDSSFKVKTPTAVAGVRGSDVIGEHDTTTGDSSFGVAEGVFAVEAGGEEIILEPGFEIDYNDVTGFTEIEEIPVEVLEEIKEEFEEINTEAEQDAATYDETSEAEEAGEEKEEEAAVEEEEPVEEISVDDVLDVIETAVDADIIETILEEVEDDFVTGDVEVIIELNNQPQ